MAEKPHILSRDVQTIAQALRANDTMITPTRPESILEYLDVLTAADVIADERGRSAPPGEPNHLIALSVLCFWPNKPPRLREITLRARKSVFGSYLSADKRKDVFGRMGPLVKIGGIVDVLEFFARTDAPEQYEREILVLPR